jgi:hypothetical protein
MLHVGNVNAKTGLSIFWKVGIVLKNLKRKTVLQLIKEIKLARATKEENFRYSNHISLL